ncbi:unnamed protein product [Effrenium voratum]|uniref:STAS domain-containing protein n=1 Tax=Effrenium voratum TaxID=2562239 RepID=A0AA36I5T8_9DINO|nr:unnamed protein product [Effrenium voratum]CAJ1458048.1 unnamed protein product [Effrenium voratum]
MVAENFGSPWPVVGVIGLCLLGYILLERRRSPWIADNLDRSTRNVSTEVMAGCMDTVTVIMRAVGMAVVLCTEEGLHDYTGLALKHILVGHLVGQVATLAFSNYETPLCTPSIEVLPLIKAMQEQISLMAPEQNESVLASTILCSSCATLASGLALYLLGLSGMGSALRFVPFSVEVSVQAMLGLVLFGLGIEASCEVDILRLGHSGAISRGMGNVPDAFVDKIRNSAFGHAWQAELFTLFLDFNIFSLWAASFLCAAAIYFFTKYVKDSPFTIAAFTFLALGIFHGIRVASGISIQAAQQSKWLYPETEYFPLWKLYELETTKDIIWSAVFFNMDKILLSAFIISVVNIACQLAVTSTLLPPKVMGTSTFDYEMIVQGRSHILASLFFGFSADYGNDDTLVHRMVGGRFRLSMWAHVLTMALCVFFVDIPKNSLPYVPRFINGCIVLLASAELLVAGFVQGYSLLTRNEFIVVCMAAAATLLCGGQVQAGLLVGIFLAFADTIRNFTLALEQLPPARDEGGAKVFELPSYIFFATAPGITAAIREELQSRVVILDWEKVRGLDTKAAMEFAQLLDKEDTRPRGALVYCGLKGPCRPLLVKAEALPEEAGSMSNASYETARGGQRGSRSRRSTRLGVRSMHLLAEEAPSISWPLEVQGMLQAKDLARLLCEEQELKLMGRGNCAGQAASGFSAGDSAGT